MSHNVTYERCCLCGKQYGLKTMLYDMDLEEFACRACHPCLYEAGKYLAELGWQPAHISIERRGNQHETL